MTSKRSALLTTPGADPETEPEPGRKANRASLFIQGGLAAALYLAGPVCPGAPVESWVTTADLKHRLSAQPAGSFMRGAPTATDRVEIDDTTVFQTILGLGSSLEPTTCSNFWRMATSEREELMERVVHPEKGLGMNLLRLCIGTPDFTGDSWYSYCDLPAGETDPELKHFSIARDRAYILPVIQLARRQNADLLFFASPWSPPGWMKSNDTLIGGQLLPKWYPAYAQYFVRFIQAYQAEGIPIYAVTVQNEPGLDRALEKDPKWHYPSCRWTAEQEREFIGHHLGPALRRAGLTTKIWCYDHNYNVKGTRTDPGLDYPRAILRDPLAAPFVNGVAFHGYVGQASGMSVLHAEFPNVPIHFSEGSVFGIEGAADLIERLRNWAMSYNAWVLMLDDQGKPNRGPFPAEYAAVALNTQTLKPDYLLGYFVYGQFMKYIPRGAVRVASHTMGRALAQVAFRNPDGSVVLVAVNPAPDERPFEIRWHDQSCRVALPPKSVGTWRWADK